MAPQSAKPGAPYPRNASCRYQEGMTELARTAALIALFPLRYFAYLTRPLVSPAVERLQELPPRLGR
jgi:hypothetical protein